MLTQISFNNINHHTRAILAIINIETMV